MWTPLCRLRRKFCYYGKDKELAKENVKNNINVYPIGSLSAGTHPSKNRQGSLYLMSSIWWILKASSIILVSRLKRIICACIVMVDGILSVVLKQFRSISKQKNNFEVHHGDGGVDEEAE